MQPDKTYEGEVRRWLLKMEEEIHDTFNDPNHPLLGQVNDLLKDHFSRNTAPLPIEEREKLNEEIQRIYQSYIAYVKDRAESEAFNRVPIGEHRLPDLPYAYNALEPYISERIMTLHHQKHHQSYVDGLNKAEKELQKQRRKGTFENIKHWERELAFHGAGHYLHTLFWETMSPEGGGRPTGELLAQIERDFGSYSAFKQQFSKAAEEVEAVGWAILVWAPRAGRLEILTAEKHQNLSQWDVIPILPLDVWEHAYYLQYENERKEYINNWWNVVNWRAVQERFNQASTNLWHPLA
ncbi:superoxide dismutase [Evansella halocellulosilytica]|uniref:superoxide dismutase n=1 Tax=Evansella halocellulosilytica TaxID=2011013 RepID=UPI00211C17BC|nr:superoxide dismutase [Evansella halocellulosilytica]